MAIVWGLRKSYRDGVDCCICKGLRVVRHRCCSIILIRPRFPPSTTECLVVGFFQRALAFFVDQMHNNTRPGRAWGTVSRLCHGSARRDPYVHRLDICRVTSNDNSSYPLDIDTIAEHSHHLHLRYDCCQLMSRGVNCHQSNLWSKSIGSQFSFSV
jgi:hypothetical protein